MAKYRNIKITVDGVKFDSKGEYHRYWQLQQLEKTGHIRSLRLKPPKWAFEIDGEFLRLKRKGSEKGTKVTWTADYDYEEYVDGKWEYVVEDYKGFLTHTSKMKHALMKLLHGIDVRITH